jgi:transcriptional regulator with XRE-family HTH domain
LAPRRRTDRRSWGRELLVRRQLLGLTRREVAALSGVPAATLTSLERGRRLPRRSVVMRLQAVPALGTPLPAGNAPAVGGRPPDLLDPLDDELCCGCWFAPEYDPLRMVGELVLRLNGLGGHLEQALLYADAASAAAYCQLTAQDPAYAGLLGAGAMGGRLLAEAAAELAASAPAMPIDVIGLGAGQAREEIQLVQDLLAKGCRPIRLLLLDCSQALLCVGYRNAASALGETAGVDVFALQGSFHNLPTYAPLLVPRRRRRIACLLGDTFAALDNELLFVRDSLGCLSPGDALLFTVPLAAAPADSPEDIWLSDPQLSAPPPAATGPRAALYEFLTGPFHRYVRDLQSLSLFSQLDAARCPVPGSYAVDYRVRVRVRAQPDRVFSLGGICKRYDAAKLAASLKQQGWQVVRTWPIEPARRLLLLCSRTAEPS